MRPLAARGPRCTPARRMMAGLAIASLLAALALAAPALAHAEEAAAWWQLSSAVTPTHLPPGAEGTISATATNLGAADVQDSGAHHITLTDKLPKGLSITSAKPVLCPVQGPEAPLCGVRWPEKNATAEPVCHSSESEGIWEASCSFPERISPYERIEVLMSVKAAASIPSPSEEINEVKVEGGEKPEGGEMPPKSLKRAVTVSNEPTPFGVEAYELSPEDEHGAPATQAGSHPFQFTTSFTFNTIFHKYPNGKTLPVVPVGLKNLHVNLPPGLIGNASKSVIAQCTEQEFTTLSTIRIGNECKPNTAIGVAVVTVTEPNNGGIVFTLPEAIYNLVPSRGEPARFGFLANGTPVTLDTVLREGDYHVQVNVNNASEAVALLASEVTIWGVPGVASHDISRGSQCLARGADAETGEKCEPPEPRNTNPFLTLPTSCAESLQTSEQAQSWLFGASPLALLAPTATETLTGCNELPFAPTVAVTPTEHQSNTPTGLTVALTAPQKTTLEEKGLAEAQIRNTIVKLPAGVQLSPSAANGLQACSLAQIGYRGRNPQTSTDEFNEHPTYEQEGSCPKASKVGTVEIVTPVLEGKLEGSEATLEGSVYLAEEQKSESEPMRNPFRSLFALYIIVEDPISGALVKLAGKVELVEDTGQITSIFPNAPQLPFSRLTLTLFSGSRASITTPRACGNYTTLASFTPWSGTAAVERSLNPEEFNITSGPGGSACASPQPFNPGFQAGSTNNQAGAFTPFTLTLTRGDADQALKGVSMTLPPGMAGLLSTVKQCGEPQAEEGTCGPESLIGSATAVAGLGATPFTETGGKVYITGPYHGAPFGLSIVLPTAAGPFDFGNVVTRSTINVDPTTAALSIGSDLPTMLNTTTHHSGVPVQLRRVDVTVERPGGAPFQFNPTNCEPMKITATLSGDQGASAPESVPFRAANCDKLPFSPKLTASTGATASKANGANLDVKIASVGVGQANIQKVFLQLPIALPSRLSTIQKACVLAVFNANPAACDEGSLVGKATIHTPVLTSALSGPAYLVSHGGAAFPDIEFVLQGEGITLILDGKTDIKKGITYSRFESAPDAPFTSFETELPTGPHSALTAFVPKTPYKLCATNLTMPTQITGQNGAVIKQNTHIAITGCPPSVTITKTRARARSILVTVKLSQAGTVKISGPGLKSVTKRGVSAGSHVITVPLTRSGRTAARRHKKVKIKASLTVGRRSVTGTATAKA